MNRRMQLLVAGAAVVVVAGAGTGIAVAGGVGDGDESPITGTELERATAAALASTGGGRVTDTEAGDEESAYEVEVTLDDGREVDVQLDEAFNVVSSSTDDDVNDDGAGDDDQSLTGTELERASAAALASTGGGRVTDTEAGDEESAYEVEVTLDEGREVDVHLDEAFTVVGSSTDDDSGDAGTDD
jgi:uncharacterized membrane protein YkoI